MLPFDPGEMKDEDDDLIEPLLPTREEWLYSLRTETTFPKKAAPYIISANPIKPHHRLSREDPHLDWLVLVIEPGKNHAG